MDGRQVLEETLARFQGAEAALTMMIDEKSSYSDDFWRLIAKREGLRLGKSYLEEGMRLLD